MNTLNRLSPLWMRSQKGKTMSLITYILFAFWVLKVHIKKREKKGAAAKVFKKIKDDNIENIAVFIVWPYVVYKWWFCKKDEPKKEVTKE